MYNQKIKVIQFFNVEGKSSWFFDSLRKRWGEIVEKLETLWTNEAREDLSQDVLQKISNKEFLRLNRDQRLQYITNPKTKSETLEKNDSFEITFKFNNKTNANLYLKTTAGQIFNENIREIETNNGMTWTRSNLSGEFFDKNGNRLVIGEWTKVTIKKILNLEEVKKMESEILEQVTLSKENKDYDLVLAAAKHGVSELIAKNLFSQILENIPKDHRKVEIEDILTEFERNKDYFYDDFRKNPVQNGKISSEFIAYYINEEHLNISETNSKNLDINKELLNNYSSAKRAEVFKGYRSMEQLSPQDREKLWDIPTELLNKWKSEQFGMKFTPGSKEAQQLFTFAAISAGLPAEWWQNQSLHNILGRESGGIVGRANYTMVREWIDGKEIKHIAESHMQAHWKNIARISWVVSTAVWLGQLTLSNEKFLPNGRHSIGIPLDEAIGMLRYIRDRYGSIDVAASIYGKTGNYTHAVTWRTLPKQFKEGY